MRALVLICVLVIAAWLTLPSCVNADQVALAFGGQLAGQVGSIEGNLKVAGPLIAVPWATLDGAKFEVMPMVQIKQPRVTLAVGPLVGSTNNPTTGATAYFGGELRSRFQLGRVALLVRLTQRQTSTALLSRFANIGLEAGNPHLKLRVSYQPIDQPLQGRSNWIDRVALRALTTYRRAIIGVEVRQNLDGTAKKTAMVDLTLSF